MVFEVKFLRKLLKVAEPTSFGAWSW